MDATTGALVWVILVGGASDDLSYGVTISSDVPTDVLVTGQFQGTATFGDFALTSRGSSDGFLMDW